MKKSENSLDFRKKIFFSLVFVVFAVIQNWIAGQIINNYFPQRTTAPDLLFRLTPYVGWTQYLTDIAIVLLAIILAAYLIPKRIAELPQVIAIFGVSEFLRGIIITLTPLGGTMGNQMNYGLTAIHQYGAFPSGHVMVMLLGYLIIKKSEAPKLKLLMLGLLFVMMISLILSRGHYSIDIVGGLLLGYFVYHEFSQHKWLELA